MGSDPFLGGAAGGQEVGSTRVGQGPLARTDVRVDRLPHDRVGELRRLARRQDLARDQHVGGPGGLSFIDPGEQCRLGETRAVAEHVHRAHHSAGCRRGIQEP